MTRVGETDFNGIIANVDGVGKIGFESETENNTGEVEKEFVLNVEGDREVSSGEIETRCPFAESVGDLENATDEVVIEKDVEERASIPEGPAVCENIG